MQLIGQFDSPFVRRVGLALTRYGMDFAHHPFSSFGESDRFAMYNPLRRVPTLVLGSGEALIDSYAILDHLDEVHGRDRALIAASGPQRRAALHRCAVATGIADKAVSFFYARNFAISLAPEFVARSEGQIRDGLAVLESACAARPDDWWFGAQPGHDDNAVACVARFLSEAYADLVKLSDYPALADHSARAEARDEFKLISQAFIPPN